MYYVTNIAAFVFLILSIVHLVFGVVSLIMRKKNGVKYLISAVACFVASGVLMLMIPEKSETLSIPHIENVVAESEESDIEIEEPEESEKSEDKLVYEDSTIAVTYRGLSDVVGNIGMAFTIENKGDHEITVYPMDSSINDTMVLFGSGFPATIRAGKKFNQVWVANPETVGISGCEDVTEIEMSFNYDDVTTDLIKISTKGD